MGKFDNYNVDEFYIDEVLADHKKSVKKGQLDEKKGEDKKKKKKHKKKDKKKKKKSKFEKISLVSSNDDDEGQVGKNNKGTEKSIKKAIKEIQKNREDNVYRERRENGTLVIKIL